MDRMRKSVQTIALPWAAIALLTLPGCLKKGVGEPCRATGSGFSMSHDGCETVCLSLWTFTCKDGKEVRPERCAGEQSCMEGTCPEGQVCIRTNVDRSFCVPDDICPEWATDGVPEPVTESDEAVKARIFKKHGGPRAPTAPAKSFD